MPSKKNSTRFLDVADEVERGDEKKIVNPKPKPKAKAKPKKKGKGKGRPATVDYERKQRMNVYMTEETRQLIKAATAYETYNKHPQLVDQSLIIQWAIEEYCKKRKIK